MEKMAKGLNFNNNSNEPSNKFIFRQPMEIQLFAAFFQRRK
jgi:hypothetical protein